MSSSSANCDCWEFVNRVVCLRVVAKVVALGVETARLS